MVRVARHAVAEHFGVYPDTAFASVFVLFENQDTGPFAHYKTVAPPVPGPRSARRIVVEPGRQRARRRETGNAEAADRGFGAAADHHVDIIEHDQARRVPDRVRPGRASGDDSVVRTL